MDNLLARERAIGWIGKSGLIIFSLGVTTGTTVISIGQVLMLVSFLLILPAYFAYWRKDPLLLLSAGFMLFLLFYTWVLVWSDPPRASANIDGLGVFLRVGFLSALIVAFWWAVLRNEGHASWPVWAFAGGFYVRLLLEWPREDWSNGIPIKLGFGLYYTLFGMLAAAVSLWWVVQLVQPGRRPGTPAIAAMLAALLVSGMGLLYSASRGAILGFLFGLLVILLLWVGHNLGRGIPWKRAGGIFAATIAIGTLLYLGPVSDRDPSGGGALSQALSQGITGYAPERPSSIGTRLVIWREGFYRWQERPFFGYGPGDTGWMLEGMERTYRIFAVGDFHSSILELLVRLGTAGALFFLAHLYLSARSLASGISNGWYGWTVSTYLLAAGCLFAVTLLFKEGFLDIRGRALTTYFLGGWYAFALRDHPFLAQQQASGSTQKSRKS
jgi:O-antigen ligase